VITDGTRMSFLIETSFAMGSPPRAHALNVPGAHDDTVSSA
jgi:hypothetical protein